MIDPDQILLLLFALLACAFFAGMEIAFMAANKLQIELDEKNNVLSGRILTHLLRHPTHLLGTTLIGYVLSLVLYGIVIAGILYTLFQAWLPGALQLAPLMLVLHVLVASVFVLLTAEFLPRSLFAISPNRMLDVLAIPMLVLYYLLYPVVILLMRLSKWIAERILKIEFSDEHPVFGATDLHAFIKNRLYHPVEEGAPEVDQEIFHNALEFKKVRVKECMVPRTEVKAVEVNDAVELLRNTFIKSGHSKILVYEDTIDNIIGYCHQLDMFQQPRHIREILSPVSLVPESMLASELFLRFGTEHRTVAVVVDEFGGTSGIVTVEDVIEEIVGEIQDEYDYDGLLEQVFPAKHLYLLSARHEIDYLNDKYELNLPEGEYETLGGLIFSVLGEIPKAGDVVELRPFTATILSMDDNRINAVKLFKDPDLQADGVF